MPQALTIDDIQKIIPNGNVWKTIHSMVDKGLIHIYEDLKESYIPKKETIILLCDAYKNEEHLKALFTTIAKAPKQEHILLTYLHISQTQEYVTQKQLLENSQATSSQLKALCDKKIFEIQKRITDRVVFNDQNELQPIYLSKLQTTTYQEINQSFEQHKPCLLLGITGSGKTHIYFKLIEDCLQANQQALYLLPEIALTAQIIKKLQNTFGNTVAIYHSKYSNHERYEVWNKVKNNACKIIIGARSALFLPFQQLGLIVVDEEHDTSYKQYDVSPRYNARDCALYLANIHKANILLASATPSLESIYNAQQKKYTHVYLNERYGQATLPTIEIIDIKKSLQEKKQEGIFTKELILAIQKALEKKEQIILFQNKRGYAPFVLCTTCGWVPECKYCDVSLTYHKYSDKLHCHYCGSKSNYISICSACGGNKIVAKSFGTEKIEEDIKHLFPNATVARFDWDALKAKNKYIEVIKQFEKKEIDILVGTQMVVKGLDFENVSVVGVLSADSLLSFPDFRTSERVYQLLEQVGGRAGRKNVQGKVYIQAYNTEKLVLHYIKNHLQKEFTTYELAIRKEFLYPPYSRIIKLTLKHKIETLVEEAAFAIATTLQSINTILVVGPAQPGIARIRNMYLQEILIKIPRDYTKTVLIKKQIKDVIMHHTQTKHFATVQVSIDVDT